MVANPPALEDAIAQHRLGHVDAAAAVYRAFTENQPDLAEPWHLLGVVELQQNNPQNAVSFFREALKRDATHVKCLSNLGGALYQLKRHAQAQVALREALRIDPDYVSAIYNLANALLADGKLDEAVAYFHKAVTIAPNLSAAHNNLAEALKLQGKFDEAVQTLQCALEQDPSNTLLSDSLIELLNDHIGDAAMRGAYAKAQEALQRVTLEPIGTPAIADETVQNIYRQCHGAHELNITTSWSQIWRGVANDPGCERHKRVFDTFNIIPKFCFGCYKVLVEPRTVMELFKLLMVFDGLVLPNDNTRKCLVEIRPEISGAYKGLIYCQDLDEARAIATLIQTATDEKISKNIPVSVRRGCSEFSVAYPAFSHSEDQSVSPMAYNEDWRAHEDDIDKNMVSHKYPLAFHTHNHTGLTLRDAIVMRIWLSYAATIGDSTYRNISAAPMPKLPIGERPALGL